MQQILLIVLGALICVAALWTVHPLWTLAPALLLIAFGLWLDDGTET